MKKIKLLLLLFISIKSVGQTTGYLRFDTVKIMKQNGTCELYIINKTKDSLGLLTNVGGGLTQFKRARALNDSSIIVGNDTIMLRGAGLTLQQVTDNGQKTTDTIVAGGLRTQHILTDTADLNDYEIDVFPDLQVESYQGADTAVLGSMFNWIVANRNTENIKALLQVGDLTQDATSSQFIRIDSNYDKIDAMPVPQLPYLAVTGNHDFDGGGVGGGRFFTMFNTYMGPSRFTGKNFYGNNLGGSNENYYIKLKAGPDSMIVIGLEFLPRNATLTWAQSVLDSFPNHKAIIVTHGYITSYGEKAMDTSRFSTQWYGLIGDNNGYEMWNKLIKQNKQIVFVFGGHYINNTTTTAQALANTNLGFPAVKRITQAGYNGNVVQQFVVNYQTDSIGGNGYFMRMKFKPRTGKLDISFFSPWVNRYDARFPSYTLDYPALTIEPTTGFSATNGSVNIAGELRSDSDVYVTKQPKNRISIYGVNGKLDTVFNDTYGKVLFSYGIDQKPAFRSIVVSDLPSDSGKYILNQSTYHQTANFKIKGIGVIGTHTNYPSVLGGLPVQFVVTTSSANWGPVSARAAGAAGGGAKWNFYTTRGTDFNNPVAVVTGDALGELNWFGTANNLTGQRSMFLRGFVYATGTAFVSSGFDFHAINTSGTDAQIMHMHPDGHTVIGPGAVSLIDRAKIDGTLLITDTTKTPNILSKNDTTNYKPVVVDASGNHFKMSGWPITVNTDAGLYTPTVTGTANTDATTAHQCRYIRIGNIVTVGGVLEIDPTVITTATTATITLPIASTFTSSDDINGVVSPNDLAEGNAHITRTGNIALLAFISGTTSNHAIYFTFSYEVK